MALRDKYNVDCAGAYNWLVIRRSFRFLDGNTSSELTVLRAKLVMEPTPSTDEGSAMNSNIPTALKKKKKKQAPGSNNGGEASRSTVIFMETSPGRNRPRGMHISTSGLSAASFAGFQISGRQRSQKACVFFQACNSCVLPTRRKH